MPTLDPLVFDSTVFDALFGVPTLLKVTVDREYRKVVSGAVVIINVYVIDTLRPNHRYLFNPVEGPCITVYYPDKTIKVSNAFMLNMEVGIYQYRHQTGIVFDDTVFDSAVFDIVNPDPIGIYTASFAARDGNSNMKTIPQEVFEVI